MASENKKKKNAYYAAIDIGSNAARLLVKHLDKDENGDPDFIKDILLRVPLRLGFDVFKLGRISEKKERNMIRLMKVYNNLMKIYEVDNYRACATSAMRDAKNGADIIKKIKKETGLEIEIIDGQEEAQMVYNNHIECMEDRNGNYMYVDVGGGSTEINLLSQGQLVSSRSYNIGTVRILNGAATDDEWQRLRDDMVQVANDYKGTNIIGSGGNINKLYRMLDDSQKDKKQMRMPINELKKLHDSLKALSVEERMEQFKLKPDRADVIVPAGDIFLTIASIINAQYIYVPVIGLADGIIDNMYAQDKAKKVAK